MPPDRRPDRGTCSRPSARLGLICSIPPPFRGQLQDVDGVGWNATWAFPAPHPPRVAGCERTLKVTYPADLAVAEAILRTSQIEP